MSATIKELQKQSHSISTNKGWWEDCPQTGSHWYPYYITAKTALISCEVSESIEEIRGGNELVYVKDGKPEGVGIELADVIIRSLDMLEHLGLDAEELIAMKSEYNRTRPHRHGGKAL